MDQKWIEAALMWAGFGHFALCLGSLFIPYLLDWRKHLQGLQLLLRQMFWTYAAYILAINFAFGLVSVLGSDELLNGSFLARSFTLLISIYWLIRILIQFLYFDRSAAPKGTIYFMGEVALIGMFITFTLIYLTAFLFNNRWI